MQSYEIITFALRDLFTTLSVDSCCSFLSQPTLATLDFQFSLSMHYHCMRLIVTSATYSYLLA